MTDYSDKVEAYQASLESFRTADNDPTAPDELVADLLTDLERARRDMEIAWLDRAVLND